MVREGKEWAEGGEETDIFCKHYEEENYSQKRNQTDRMLILQLLVNVGTMAYYIVVCAI